MNATTQTITKSTSKTQSDWVSQSKDKMVLNTIHNDLEQIEDIHQIKLSLVGLTRKITTSDTNRQMALIEILHALSRLETAQNLIRTAQTN